MTRRHNGTSIRSGIAFMRHLRRRFSRPASPVYTPFDPSDKQDGLDLKPEPLEGGTRGVALGSELDTDLSELAVIRVIGA